MIEHGTYSTDVSEQKPGSQSCTLVISTSNNLFVVLQHILMEFEVIGSSCGA